MSSCLVTGGSRNDIAPIAVLLMNIRATQSWVDHVVVYHDGIPEKQQRLMKQIMSVEFIRYKFPGSRRNFHVNIRYVYTEMIFCKYECLKLLERFDIVVWTDYDVVFQRDVPELLEFSRDSSGFKSLMAVRGDTCDTFGGQITWEGRGGLSAICPLDYLNICTGLMVFSRAQFKGYSAFYSRCIEYTERYGAYLTLPEQAVFDMICYQTKLVPEVISWDYAARPTNANPQSDKPILHAVSQPKFWNGLHNDIWNENYARWLQMGGGEWKPPHFFSLRELCKRYAFFKKRFFG